MKGDDVDYIWHDHTDAELDAEDIRDLRAALAAATACAERYKSALSHITDKCSCGALNPHLAEHDRHCCCMIAARALAAAPVGAQDEQASLPRPPGCKCLFLNEVDPACPVHGGRAPIPERET